MAVDLINFALFNKDITEAWISSYLDETIDFLAINTKSKPFTISILEISSLNLLLHLFLTTALPILLETIKPILVLSSAKNNSCFETTKTKLWSDQLCPVFLTLWKSLVFNNLFCLFNPNHPDYTGIRLTKL